jgi:hypothetical protein
VPRGEGPRTPEERERERELGLAFSEKLRDSYQASRFREGVEWLEGRDDGDGPDPDEAA